MECGKSRQVLLTTKRPLETSTTCLDNIVLLEKKHFTSMTGGRRLNAFFCIYIPPIGTDVHPFCLTKNKSTFAFDPILSIGTIHESASDGSIHSQPNGATRQLILRAVQYLCRVVYGSVFVSCSLRFSTCVV